MNLFNLSDVENVHVYLNLLLVKNGARTATLIESSNFGWSTEMAKKTFCDFRKQWAKEPCCGSLFENENVDASPRLLVYNKRLVNKLGITLSGNIDSVLGQVLDFVCPDELYGEGQQYTWIIKASSSKILNGQDVDLRTEVCTRAPEEVKPKILTTTKAYQKTLRPYFRDITVSFVMNTVMSTDSIMDSLNNFLQTGDKTGVVNVKEELANELSNQSFYATAKEIENAEEADITKENVSLWKNLFIHTLFDPLSIFYPLSTEQAQYVEKTMADLEQELRKFTYNGWVKREQTF
jgi:hypothetical protein